MQDVLIIGAGIFGLTLARALLAQGRDAVIAEAFEVGAGASATPLGVLAPHAPDPWNAKKRSQLEALTTLPRYLASLEDESGIAIQYRRCARLIPLANAQQRELWEVRAEASRSVWQGEAELTLHDWYDDEWLDPETALGGVVRCGLTARLDARAYLMALAASIGEQRILTGRKLTSLEDGTAHFENGETIRAKQIILATGVSSFDFLPPSPDGTPAGRGEKGQAALLRLRTAIDATEHPLIFRDRTYVVPRGPSLVAVGATSERDYDDPLSTDELLDERIEDGRALCPALVGAEIVERWAHERPRAPDRKLMFGPHPTQPSVLIATGGFKTGLAMAHTLPQMLTSNVML